MADPAFKGDPCSPKAGPACDTPDSATIVFARQASALPRAQRHSACCRTPAERLNAQQLYEAPFNAKTVAAAPTASMRSTRAAPS
jgi:hypothetical protein